MPGLSQNDSPNLTSPVEKAGYYGDHYGGYYGVRVTGIGEATGTTGRMDITAGITTPTTATATTALLASGAVTVRTGGLHSADLIGAWRSRCGFLVDPRSILSKDSYASLRDSC